MSASLHKRHPAILWALMGLAAGFGLLVHFWPGLTGNDNVNGLGGVFLGLFIAAFPAANFLAMLLSELGNVRWGAIKRADLPWVVLNLLVLLTGMLVVMEGTRLFYKHWVPAG